MVTYADVRRVYPFYQLPRGTNGWEAATRTVNGGAGWTPKPKPVPTLTHAQKIEQTVKRLIVSSGTRVVGAGNFIATAILAFLRDCLYAFIVAILM